jgi:uncharacterized protein
LTNNLQNRFENIVRDSIIGQVLPIIAKSDLPSWWLAGGAVRNTVWKHLYGSDCALSIKDFDVAFFDQNGGRQQELTAKAAMESQFPGHLFDVKNQASFAVWRPGRRPYSSCEDGIGNWLHTATAVGVRIDRNGILEVLAPYGLEDLFNGTIRPTPEHMNGEEARKKASTFVEKCAALRIESLV